MFNQTSNLFTTRLHRIYLSNKCQYYSSLKSFTKIVNNCHHYNRSCVVTLHHIHQTTARNYSLKQTQQTNAAQDVVYRNNVINGDSKVILLHCPKWSSMYDICYNGKVSTKLGDDIENISSDDSADNNKAVARDLDECEDWKRVQPLTLSSLAKYYSRLSKARLTGLVVLTTLAGYYMGVQTAIDPALLSATLLGTALTSASATTLNQYLEIPFDSQMARTRNRPLVLCQLTPLHAFNFAIVTGLTGLCLLSYVNPLTAVLGATNLVLYALIYTPMKRVHIINTWIGAIVGAIPPVMGFTAATNCIDMSALLVGLLLYSWQFPHFNALSWNMRHDYARAGYRMMSVTEPTLCTNTSLRHSCLILVYSSLMCVSLTTWTFLPLSAPFNLYFIYLSWKFRADPTANTSRKLFRYSLIHLPVVILLMLATKRKSNDELNSSNNINVVNSNDNLTCI